MNIKCKVCQSSDFDNSIQFGSQPVSHHYLSPKDKINTELDIPLTLCQCYNCGTIQLKNLAELTYYNVRFPWVRQNEPEAHLDNLVQQIISLPRINSNSSIWGMSYKDKTTIDRFRDFGFKNCRTIDYSNMVNSQDQINNISLTQSLVNRTVIKRLINNDGKPDVIIARHLLEHAHNTSDFLKALQMVTSCGCYLVLEIPECSRLIHKLDYTMLWEEHITYFTDFTLRQAVRLHYLEELESETIEYPYEDILIMILKCGVAEKGLSKNSRRINQNKLAFQNYVESFTDTKTKIIKAMDKMKSTGQKIAFYGSGHIASTFINSFEIDGYIEFAIDDDTNKTGLRMPGSELPIYPSEQIYSENIDVCLIAMSYENEQKVKERNKKFIKNGGQLLPISPNANYSIYDIV